MANRPDPEKVKTSRWGLGLSPFDYMTLTVVRGSSYPMMYAEIGMGVSAMLRREGGADLPEALFRKPFFDLCDRGLIVWADREQAFENPRERRFILARPRGDAAMRDFKIARGDEFRFARYFDGTSQALNRYLGVGPKIQLNSQRHKRSQVFAEHNASPWALNKVTD